MNGIPIAVVDAFAERAFRGNPAAVCRLPAPGDSRWMQAVAAELNLSETAFVSPRSDGDWDLRWFTPQVEVDLCGHATLAAAHVLAETEFVAAGAALRFHTRSGVLECRPGPAGLALDFPRRDSARSEPEPGLLAALGAGVKALAVERSVDDWLVELSDAAAVRGLSPDLAALARVPGRGVIVTSRSDDPGFDFVSRFFAPSVGVPEDPVTGSAHCTLAAYWAVRLGRTRLRGWQASARGGSVGVELAGDRVRLSGRAVTVWSGVLSAAAGLQFGDRPEENSAR